MFQIALTYWFCIFRTLCLCHHWTNVQNIYIWLHQCRVSIYSVTRLNSENQPIKTLLAHHQPMADYRYLGQTRAWHSFLYHLQVCQGRLTWKMEDKVPGEWIQNHHPCLLFLHVSWPMSCAWIDWEIDWNVILEIGFAIVMNHVQGQSYLINCCKFTPSTSIVPNER